MSEITGVEHIPGAHRPSAGALAALEAVRSIGQGLIKEADASSRAPSIYFFDAEAIASRLYVLEKWLAFSRYLLENEPKSEQLSPGPSAKSPDTRTRQQERPVASS